MRVLHPNLIVNVGIERIITLPSFNVALANGQVMSVVASTPVKRIMDFQRDGTGELIPLYAEFNNLSVANVLSAINRILDLTSAQYAANPTGATALHEYFTPNARVARGGMITGRVMSPFSASPRQWNQYKNNIASAFGGDPSDSLIMWLQHIAYMLVDERYIKYEPNFIEYVIEANEYELTDNYNDLNTPEEIAAHSEIPQDILMMHYNTPFSANNMTNHVDVKNILESYKMPEQRVGINIQEMTYRLEHLLLVSNGINVLNYITPAWDRIPNYKIWFIRGNNGVRTLPSIFNVQYDTFRFDTEQAVAHFGDFRNSVIIGWDTDIIMEGLRPERAAKISIVVNNNLKVGIDLRSKGDGCSDRSTHPFNRPVPVLYQLSSMAWYKQQIIDGQHIRLPQDMTNDELYRGLLKFKILSSQGRQFTNMFHIQAEIPMLVLPFLEDKEVLDFYNGLAYPTLVHATNTAGPNHVQMLNFHMPLVVPKLEAFKVPIPDLGQWHVGSNELHLFIQGSNMMMVRNSRYHYGLNPENLEAVVNYYINTFLLLTALEMYRGDTYVNTGFDATGTIIPRMDAAEWIRRQTEWNVVEYIRAMSIANSITDNVEVSPATFGG